MFRADTCAGLSEFATYPIPTLLGNVVGGITFTGLVLSTTHVRTAPKRQPLAIAPAASMAAEGAE